MKAVVLRAHFDGEHIQLDEPFELEPGTPVRVMVLGDDPEPTSTKPVTLRNLVELLRREGSPDPDFADDLEAIQRNQPPAGETPWPS